jgi:hypothetical protein
LVIKLKNNFSALKRKIFFWAIVTPIISLLIGLVILYVFIDGIFQDPFADAFVFIFRQLLRMSEANSISLYHSVFRDNKATWVLAGYILLMFIIFYRADCDTYGKDRRPSGVGGRGKQQNGRGHGTFGQSGGCVKGLRLSGGCIGPGDLPAVSGGACGVRRRRKSGGKAQAGGGGIRPYRAWFG